MACMVCCVAACLALLFGSTYRLFSAHLSCKPLYDWEFYAPDTRSALPARCVGSLGYWPVYDTCYIWISEGLANGVFPALSLVGAHSGPAGTFSPGCGPDHLQSGNAHS